MRKDHKSTKRHQQLDCLFALLGSTCVKASLKHVGEINHFSQFHQHFTIEQLFCTNMLCTAFQCFLFGFAFFCHKEIGKKLLVMLVKLTPYAANGSQKTYLYKCK
jgi:hypothetical protein